MKAHTQHGKMRGAKTDGTNSAGGWSFARDNLLLALWLLLLLGFALTVIAVLIASQHSTATGRVVAALASSVAGGLIGAVSTIIVSDRVENVGLSEIRQMLAATTGSNFFSDEAMLEAVRKPWHHYRITQVDGVTVWRYCVYRFDQSASIGTITTKVDYVNPRAGAKHTYSVEAGVRGSRLIVIDTRLEGDEAPVIQVYPHMLFGFQPIHCGIVFVQTWDGNHVVSPAILSQSPLVSGLPEGTVQSTDAADLLKKTWKRQFFTDNATLLTDRPPHPKGGDGPSVKAAP